MLPGLHRHTLIGGNDQQGGVDMAGAGHHSFNKLLVARNVNEDELFLVTGDVQKDEPQLDGQPAGFFFRQRVRVGAGQGLDQGTLAVVDVARRPDYDVLFFRHHDLSGFLRNNILPSDLSTIRPMTAARSNPAPLSFFKTASAFFAPTHISSPPDVWGS